MGSSGVGESQAERTSHGDFDNRLLPQSDSFGQPRSAATEWLPGCPWTRLSGPDFDTSGACEGSLDPAPVCTSNNIFIQPTPVLGGATGPTTAPRAAGDALDSTSTLRSTSVRSSSRSHRSAPLCQGTNRACCDGNGGFRGSVGALDEGRTSDLSSRGLSQLLCSCAQGASRGLATTPIVQDQRGLPAAPPTGYSASECNRCGDLHFRVPTSSLSGGATAVLGGSPSTTDRGSGLSPSGRGIPEQLLLVVSPGDSSRLHSGPAFGRLLCGTCGTTSPIRRVPRNPSTRTFVKWYCGTSRSSSCGPRTTSGPRGVPVRTQRSQTATGNRDWFLLPISALPSGKKGSLRQGLWIHPAPLPAAQTRGSSVSPDP